LCKKKDDRPSKTMEEAIVFWYGVVGGGTIAVTFAKSLNWSGGSGNISTTATTIARQPLHWLK
jgi:hypothetical protein